MSYTTFVAKSETYVQVFMLEVQLTVALCCSFPSWKFLLTKLNGTHNAPESPGLSQLEFNVFPFCVKCEC